VAYFPNGISGVVLDEQCYECLPYDPCPIAWVQTEFNYTQCNQPDMERLMNCLVDENGVCKMKQFVAPRLKDPDTPLALQRPLVFGDTEQIEALKP